MALEIITVPCLSDNYAYLVKGPGGVCLIDAPEAAPVIAELDARGWTLSAILITHHHWDHVEGLADLRARYDCPVMGPAAEEAKLPAMDHLLADGATIEVVGTPVTVMPVPGHTLGHVAFHFTEGAAVFTADSLMALGCGRIFEGTPDMMWKSLSSLAALPPETMVYSGHEYTTTNAKFALTIEPENAALKSRADDIAKARTEGRPTAACKLSEELATNPFLRPNSPAIRKRLNLSDASNSDVFREIRARKDSF